MEDSVSAALVLAESALALVLDVLLIFIVFFFRLLFLFFLLLVVVFPLPIPAFKVYDLHINIIHINFFRLWCLSRAHFRLG